MIQSIVEHMRSEAMELQGTYQIIATKLGREIPFDVTVYEHPGAESSVYSAETQTQDPFNHMIQFIVREAENATDALAQMNAQMSYRGFTALRIRSRSTKDALGRSKWEEWRSLTA